MANSTTFQLHAERHRVGRIGWLRAAVLGANDGIVSTASLILGVAAAGAGRSELLLAGVAGLTAGALSMAAGEYVSVSSQSDTEKADIARERFELNAEPQAELDELARIYVRRGLDRPLAIQVAKQLTAKDPLAAHCRDELSISAVTTARPLQAAVASAASFSIGAALPLLAALLGPPNALELVIGVSSFAFLAGLGVAGAMTGGAPILKSVLRVAIWGAIAMIVTAGVGRLFHTVV